MKNKKLLDAIGQIQDKYIIEAESKGKAVKKNIFIRWGIAACLILTLVIGISILYNYKTKNNFNGKPTISHISASFAIDLSDKRQAVGYADYVFVAKVKNNVKTIYKDPVQIETENGPKKLSTPHTVYSIEILENIKGRLKKGTIEIEKEGGLSEDGKTIILYEDDNLLKVGKYYILLGYGQPDGSILVSGPDSGVMLKTNSKKNIKSSKEFMEYVKAKKEEIITKRDRSKSRFDLSN